MVSGLGAWPLPRPAPAFYFQKKGSFLESQLQRKTIVFAIFDAKLYVSTMITPAQCRAARGLLDWTQEELATTSKVSAVTIRNFENGKTSPQESTLTLLEMVFEKHGVGFIPDNGGGPGLRLKK